MRTRNLSRLVLSALALLLLATASDAQEATSPILTSEILQQPDVQKVFSGAKDTFSTAIRGDSAAVRALVAEYLIPSVIALVILIAGYMVASFVGRLVGQFVANRVDLTLGKFSGKMTTNGIMILVLLAVLSRSGFDVTSVAALLAAAGFAVGMALQGTLSNFAAGVMLLVFRPFKVGDYIKVADIAGVVDEIDLFTTKLNSADNRHLIVPNGQIFGSVIENYTRNSVRRVDVNVGAAYSADIRHTRKVLTDAIAVIPGAVVDPAPEVYLLQLGDSSVDWQCRVWCRPENYWDVRQRVTAAAKDSMDLAGIGIPFPQLDLHVVSGLAGRQAA